jgi:hypothetical protein
MVSVAIKQQILLEQRKRIAALMLENLFSYSTYSSATIINNDDENIPKGTSSEDAKAKRLQIRRRKDCLLTAHLIQRLMAGELE